VAYPERIPKLWHETIKAHRREVHEAILDTAAALVAQHGLRSVTMSLIAEQTGIGRATLYKYFPDVDAILVAWHDRHVRAHLERLGRVRDGAGEPRARLEAVLEAYAAMTYERPHGHELAPFLHQGPRFAVSERQLRDLIRDVLVEGVRADEVRDDVEPDELVQYCLHALAAAGTVSSVAAVRRLVTVTLAGLRPSKAPSTPVDTNRYKEEARGAQR
jgi:AcrR family transcriptional regulator